MTRYARVPMSRSRSFSPEAECPAPTPRGSISVEVAATPVVIGGCSWAAVGRNTAALTAVRMTANAVGALRGAVSWL